VFFLKQIDRANLFSKNCDISWYMPSTRTRQFQGGSPCAKSSNSSKTAAVRLRLPSDFRYSSREVSSARIRTGDVILSRSRSWTTFSLSPTLSKFPQTSSLSRDRRPQKTPASSDRTSHAPFHARYQKRELRPQRNRLRSRHLRRVPCPGLRFFHHRSRILFGLA